jgi:2-polyprenyl-6-methoxyphenol hydroxylase-like FAD-dependent oxidoreductase
VHVVQSLPRWSHGRIIVIGDAAHSVSPNAGQGAFMALEDAMLLAKLVRDCGGQIERAFETFADQRRTRVEKVVADGRRRAIDKEIVSPFQSRIRNVVFGLMLRLFGERSQRWLYEYKIDWAKWRVIRRADVLFLSHQKSARSYLIGKHRLRL